MKFVLERMLGVLPLRYPVVLINSARREPSSASPLADTLHASQTVVLIFERLKKGGVVSARSEAEQLVQFFTNSARIDLYTGDIELSASQEEKLYAAVEKRVEGMPLAYVLGETEFFGNKFFVDENVLVPRPETEILVQEALKLILTSTRATEKPQILDLCTGSGCIAVSLTLQRPDIRMSALDVSEEALSIARKNRDFHGLENEIALFHSDLFEALSRGFDATFDMIVSNPPYIPERDLVDLPREVRREPRLALDGGRDGIRLIEKILRQAGRYLKPGGHLLLEIGDGQAETLANLLAPMTNYKDVHFIKDYNGVDRVLIAKHG